jgi:hypothetical protein
MAKIKHIAFLKFKPGTSVEQVDTLMNELLDLSESIPGIEDYVAGENTSPEGKNQGYTHAFVMTFSDAAARDAYLPHPDHERFKANALAHIESVAVLDFEV